MATAPPLEELYPKLSPQLNLEKAQQHQQDFRYPEAINAKNFIERDVDGSLSIYKRYKRIRRVLALIRNFLHFVALLFGVAGIASLRKILQYDLAMYSASVCVGMELLQMILSHIEGKIIKSIEEHDEVHTAAAGSLSRVMDIISKALNDGHISEQELNSILREKDKYLEMRKSIRTKHFHYSDAQDLKKQFHDLEKQLGDLKKN